MQAPTAEIAQKATLLDNLWNDEFVEGFQAMGQWSRDHVPFPGALFRELVEELVRKNVLMTGAIRVGDRKIELANARGNVLNAMAERDRRAPRGGRAVMKPDRRSGAARGAAPARRARHVRHRPQRGQAHDAPPYRLDHRGIQTNCPQRRSS